MRRYVSILLFNFIIACIGLSAYAFFLEPLDGDLTRIGWVAERDFGWKEPQIINTEAKYRVGPYDRYYDIVVIGDSFSGMHAKVSNLPEQQQWQSHLAARTRLTVLTIDRHVDDFSLESFMSSPVFQAHPPKLVIFEMVERDIVNYFKKRSQDCTIGDLPDAQSPIMPELVPTPVETTTRERGKRHMVDKLNPGYARTYILKNMLKFLGYRGNALTIPLTNRKLFSNAANDSLLVYAEDLKKASWKTSDIDLARCSILKIKKRFEANGQTRFLSIIAPDKLSIYADYLIDNSYAKLSRLDELNNQALQFDLRLDRVLKEAVQLGGVDIYLPNDTHWGGLGHALVAEALVDFLNHGSGSDYRRWLKDSRLLLGVG